MTQKRVGYWFVLMMAIGFVGQINAKDQSCAISGKKNTCILQSCDCWAAQDDISLEVGKVLLHFSDNPMVLPLPSTVQASRNNDIFFISDADISPDALQSLKEVAKRNSNKWYSISISHEKKPIHVQGAKKLIQGIKVVFTYDPEKIEIKYSPFDTLGMHKGVWFRLYNKAIVNQLKAKERTLLRLTQLTPFSVTA